MLVNLSRITACYLRSRWVVDRRATGDSKKSGNRVDGVAEDSLHNIAGIATEQREERLPDCRWHR